MAAWSHSDMRVLLTGGAGLIGMSARAVLKEAGHEVLPIDVTRFDRDDPELRILPLEDAVGLRRLVDEHSIEAIVHCGAISGPMMAKGRPDLLVRVNIDASAALLDLARQFAMKRFVFCSSISVYGDVGNAVIDEATPTVPTSVYGATKVSCEQLIQGFASEYGLAGASLRIARVYGPYRRANCFLRAAILDAAAGRETIIPCAPDFIYHYVHVDDVSQAIATLLVSEDLPHRIYNIGSGEAMTMPQIAAILEEVIPNARIRLVTGADDVPDVQTEFDISRAARDLEWRPRLGLRLGLQDYHEAFRKGRIA